MWQATYTFRGSLDQEEVAALNEALDAVGDSEMLLGGLHRELFRDLLVHPKWCGI